MKRKNKIPRFIATFVLLSFFSACSTSPDKIRGSYVSSYQYQKYNCHQIESELTRVSQKVSEVTGQQRKEATKDAVAMAAGLVIFWPAFFFLVGEDKKEELARLKGEHEALQNIHRERGCTTVGTHKTAGTHKTTSTHKILF